MLHHKRLIYSFSEVKRPSDEYECSCFDLKRTTASNGKALEMPLTQPHKARKSKAPSLQQGNSVDTNAIVEGDQNMNRRNAVTVQRAKKRGRYNIDRKDRVTASRGVAVQGIREQASSIKMNLESSFPHCLWDGTCWRCRVYCAYTSHPALALVINTVDHLKMDPDCLKG
jgi:hypothetical protein